MPSKTSDNMRSAVQLPSGSSSSLALVHPTREELLNQFKLNGAEWRAALSPEAYLRREDYLANQDLTRDGGISYWILIDRDCHNALDPQSSARLPLASCETFRKRALVWKDGKVQETITHGIGSVFCASHLRKRGYAQRLMTELGKALRTYQAEEKECLFSVLYSDIGKSFYAGFGWEPYDSAHLSIPATSKAFPGLPTVRPLYDADLDELCNLDEEHITKQLEARPKDSKIAVVLTPDVQTIRWHHARENFVGNELHGRTPEIKGAIVGTEKGKRVWCYWTRMWFNPDPSESKENTFYILRMVAEDEEQDNTDAIAALLALGQQEAEKWKMEKVEVWNPSAATTAAARKLYNDVEIVERDTESIASLRWHGELERPVTEVVDWVHIEKYVWC